MAVGMRWLCGIQCGGDLQRTESQSSSKDVEIWVEHTGYTPLAWPAHTPRGQAEPFENRARHRSRIALAPFENRAR